MNEKMNTCDCSECVIRNLIFAHLKPDEFSNICQLKTEKFFKKGQIIIEKGQQLEYLIYIKSGLVKCYYQINESKQSIIAISVPYDALTLLTIFHPEQIALYNISVLEDSNVCFIPVKLIRDLIKSNGEFAIDFISKLTIVSNKVIEHFITLNSKNLRGRVAYFLLNLADKIYRKDTYELPVSRKEIAELIGMTTENVIRTLSEFRKEKIIKINGKEIEIIEKDRLYKISQYG